MIATRVVRCLRFSAAGAARAPSKQRPTRESRLQTGTPEDVAFWSVHSLLGGLLGLLACLLLGFLGIGSLLLDAVDLLNHEGTSDPRKN